MEVYVVEGNTVIPVKNNEIRMVSEDVRMYEEQESRQAEAPGKLPFLKAKEQISVSKGFKVKAAFEFENMSTKTVTMKMGFPVIGGSGPADFKVWIKQAAVEVDHREMGRTGEIVLKASSGIVPDIYVWDISFSPKERKSVQVEYYGEWGAPVDGNPYAYFIYIAVTGALWNNPIERAHFTLQLPEHVSRIFKDDRYKNRFTLQIKPENYKRSNNDVIEWTFLNWTPNHNIGVAVEEKANIGSFRALLDSSEKIALVSSESYALEQYAIDRCISYFKGKDYSGDKIAYSSTDVEAWKDVEDPGSVKADIIRKLYVRTLRNEIYARHGRIFNSSDMSRIFDSMPWYKRRGVFKEAELNSYEKKNVDFLVNYEKQQGWK